ncbi:hypothetical protein CERSUDRAFT_121532 [Gelatoporia subvermispora B]|uniref:N-acetyltransferase domain-containing protein n=1 Tax=Ceriporiopsis subvermispora (strain B) TaxID=914234 RepID=M2RPV2_CERS8|nr:hypothetical protein CERSUDRAFT_121532 [Gelatoporia subvermispora B]
MRVRILQWGGDRDEPDVERTASHRTSRMWWPISPESIARVPKGDPVDTVMSDKGRMYRNAGRSDVAELQVSMEKRARHALGSHEPKPLKYKDVPKAVESARDAFENDPFFHYLSDTPDRNKARFEKQRKDISTILTLYAFIRSRHALTVNSGEAMAFYRLAPNDTPVSSPLNRMLDAIAKRTQKALGIFQSPEQRKRNAEAIAKRDAILKKLFGDEISDMAELAGLATAPAAQGRGYGTALVREVTTIADAYGRSTWLVSSNVNNTGFYESVGFRVVGEFALGENNPTWGKAPVIIRIMVRPYSTH